VGYRKPSDYEFQFSSSVVDTSVENSDFFPSADATPLKFRIFNKTDSAYIKCLYYDLSGIGQGALASNDQIVFLEKNPLGVYSPTWTIFVPPDTAHPLIQLGNGVKLTLNTVKPFRYGDLLQFTPKQASLDNSRAASSVANVRVVPNPYVTASSFELPLNPGITSGRGKRKIDFINLPANSTIRIYTTRGDYVQTLHQDGNIESGTVSWDLRTYENLDVAFGVYFYVVESPVGNTTGKIAIIK